MTKITLLDLQESVKDKTAFNTLGDYSRLCHTFLDLIQQTKPTRIISPTRNNYIFYQYGDDYDNKITRPLNTDLFIENPTHFQQAFERFISFLDDLRVHQEATQRRKGIKDYLDNREPSKIIYTMQQAIGSIGDSFANANQSRKRIGQLFENLIMLSIKTLDFDCESRTIKVPIPDQPDHTMSYQLDLVFSRSKAIITSETRFIHPNEIIGSVKTTSKDRIDKIFLDKFLLSKLLGRDIPVIALFLHDVQRARRGQSIFGINSTFKTNHFLGYTIALNRLDGVYYIDLGREMLANKHLKEEIRDFQRFLTQDLWTLTEI